MSESSSKNNSKTSKGKTFDVSHPGKSTPSATSRPVIIGHGSMIEDPMVQSGRKEAEKPPELPPKPMRATAEKVVEAPESLKLKQPGEMPTVEEAQDEEAKPDIPQSEEPQPEESESNDDSTNSQEAVVDSVANQAAEKKQQSEADKKAAEQSARIVELIEKKTYFVPINVAKRHRNNRTIAVVLFVLFALGVIGGMLYVSGALNNL